MPTDENRAKYAQIFLYEEEKQFDLRCKEEHGFRPDPTLIASFQQMMIQHNKFAKTFKMARELQALLPTQDIRVSS